MQDVKNINLPHIIKRLELIKGYISLEELEEVNKQIFKMEEMILPTDVQNIVILLKQKSYSQAIATIDNFITGHHRVAFYNDPEIAALKFEIKSLEGEINTLSEEKADLEKLIHEFGIQHNKELGELIIKILQFRKINAKGVNEQREAEEDYNTYRKEYEASKDEQSIKLTLEEQHELKDKYRKASKLCHPDVVSEEQKELATKLFAELSIAYDKNDLNRVREILTNLENGHFFVNKSEAINEKILLKNEMEKLRLRIKELREQMQIITQSDTFKTIMSIDNWETYFKNAKQKLNAQLNDLEIGK